MIETSGAEGTRKDCSTLIRVESAHGEEPLQVPSKQRVHRRGRRAAGCRRCILRGRDRDSAVDRRVPLIRSRDANHRAVRCDACRRDGGIRCTRGTRRGDAATAHPTQRLCGAFGASAVRSQNDERSRNSARVAGSDGAGRTATNHRGRGTLRPTCIAADCSAGRVRTAEPHRRQRQALQPAGAFSTSNASLSARPSS